MSFYKWLDISILALQLEISFLIDKIFGTHFLPGLSEIALDFGTVRVWEGS